MSKGDDQIPRVAKGRLIVGDREIHLTRLEELVIWLLAAKSPGPATIKDMVYFCYGDREDGGPLYANQIMRVKVSTLRRKLAGIPWVINAHFGGTGYSINRKNRAP